MNKFNFFNVQSGYYPFRWFFIITLFIALFLAWHNLNGGRMFARGNQQWSSSGPGYHK